MHLMEVKKNTEQVCESKNKRENNLKGIAKYQIQLTLILQAIYLNEINFLKNWFSRKNLIQIFCESWITCYRIFSYEIKKKVFTRLTRDLIYAIENSKSPLELNFTNLEIWFTGTTFAKSIKTREILEI